MSGDHSADLIDTITSKVSVLVSSGVDILLGHWSGKAKDFINGIYR